jgi:hypothetical protein
MYDSRYFLGGSTMFGSDILDIAIGMVFVFLALSLVCSAASEGIEALLKNRAKNLEKGISELLGDPKNETKFINALYNHGLVNSLFAGRYEDHKGFLSHVTTDLPSYIPAESFALAVIDLAENPPTDLKLPSNLETALRTFGSSADGDLAKCQASLEQWYNNSMDRVSGWYKRTTQGILFALGLIIAVAINVDTVSIGRALSDDASLRKGLVAVATARASTPLKTGDGANAAENLIAEIKSDVHGLESLGLPIGWPGNPVGPEAWLDRLRDQTPTHAMGWLLTAIAVSFGAPFWFDLLNRFIRVRSALKPDEKS